MREQNHGVDEDPRYRHSLAEAVDEKKRLASTLIALFDRGESRGPACAERACGQAAMTAHNCRNAWGRAGHALMQIPLRCGNNPDFGVASPARSFAAATAATGHSLKAISPLSCLVRPLHSV